MKKTILFLMACAMTGFTTASAQQEVAKKDSPVTHDVAVYEKLTRDGASDKPIFWYIGTKGDTVWQVTGNFEATDAVALKLGRNLKAGKVTFTPQGAVVLGRSNYAMAENWAFLPLSKRASFFNLTQALKGVGGPKDYAYTFNKLAYRFRNKVEISALTQHTFTRGDKPANEFGGGLELPLPKGMYLPVQAFKPIGGQFKVLVGFGFRR